MCCNGSEMVHIGPHVNEELQGIQRCCIDAEEVRLACNDKLEYMKTESLSGILVYVNTMDIRGWDDSILVLLLELHCK